MDVDWLVELVLIEVEALVELVLMLLLVDDVEVVAETVVLVDTEVEVD